MSMIRRIITHLRRRLAEQDGVVLLYALGATIIVLGLSGAALTALTYDSSGTSSDTSQKQAYAAAEAGIQRYLFELNTNNTYWEQCGAGANWIVNTGASGTPQAVPGSSTETYLVMLLPAVGQNTYTQCSIGDPVDSMIQASGVDSGTLRIASTGYSGTAKRTVVAAIRQQNFLDYDYFTNLETSDPLVQVDDAFFSTGNQDTAIEPPGECAAQGTLAPSGCGSSYQAALTGGTVQGVSYPGATSLCSQYRWSRGTSPFYAWNYGGGSAYPFSCTNIQFIAGDQLNGPVHTNDSVLLCGSPTFGQSGYNDSIEFGGTSAYPAGYSEASGCSGAPKVNGTYTAPDTNLHIPKSNTALQQYADYSFTGTTCINFTATAVQVQVLTTNLQSCPTNVTYSQTIPYSSLTNGVLYVANGACTYNYDVDYPLYSGNIGCGNAYVKGTPAYPVTINAESDIIVDGNITYPSPNTNGGMLGLIAQGFVRVYHPLAGNAACTSSNPPANATGYTPITEIDAAILSLNHSFIVDNYACGANLGTLKVVGSIAQNYRGTVGSGSSGYTKNYVYDRRLQYSEPPHFLAPTNGSYSIAYQTECEVAATCDGTS